MCYVKDGLSQNLPETFGCGGFGQVPEFFISIYIFSKFFINNKIQKSTGNCWSWFPEVYKGFIVDSTSICSSWPYNPILNICSVH